MTAQTTPVIEKVVFKSPNFNHTDRRHISYFKGFDWLNASKEDAVHFARATGFKETGMSLNEVALLCECLELKKPKSIVELGRNYGTSTRLFVQHVIRHGGIVESWDWKHWPGFIEIMTENGYPLNSDASTDLPNGAAVYLKTADSIKSPIHPEFTVDFLLIDTEHSIEDALGEYMRWRRYLQGGAMIAFHDSSLSQVARAIEIVKEVEGWGGRDRIWREWVNEHIDGFGVHILELKR